MSFPIRKIGMLKMPKIAMLSTMRFAGIEGKIIDLEDTIFGYFDGKLVILGKRDLPVHVRHQYCHSRHSGKIKQKRSKRIHTNISRWLGGNLPQKISVDWKLIYA